MRRGFTLLEVLLATALASVVALAVASVVSVSHSAQEQVRGRSERRALLRALERKIANDLRGVVPPGGVYAAGLVGEDQVGTSGGEPLLDPELAAQVSQQVSGDADPPPVDERDRLTLAVLPPARTFGAETPEGEGALLNVIYQIDDDPETEERGLVRVVDRVRDLAPGFEPEPPEEVCREVVGMDLAFFDGQDWQETWDSGSSDTLPTAIEMTLVLAVDAEVFTYRITVAPPQGRLSQIQEADE